MLLAILAVAAHHATLVDHLITIGSVAAAIGAITAVGLFLWTRLRLDKAWGWLVKNIKADQKQARMQEYAEAQGTPEIAAIRRKDLTEVIQAEIGPKLDALEKNQTTLHSCLDRNTAKVDEIGTLVANISEEQKRVAEQLKGAQDKVDEVAEGITSDRVIMHDHIEADKEFQDRAEDMWTKIPGLLEDNASTAV